MNIEGTDSWIGDRPNPVTKKQWNVIDIIEKAYQGRVKFEGHNSSDAYEFIGRYHKNVKSVDGKIYLNGRYICGR